MIGNFKKKWIRFWMLFVGLGFFGRAATYLVSLFAPPHKAGQALAMMRPKGYIAPSAMVFHSKVRLGENIFLADRVLLFEGKNGGAIVLGNKVAILRDTILETGDEGQIVIGDETYIHPRCQLNAYLTEIKVGKRVLIAANCAFYTHNHGIKPGERIISQPRVSKGPIVIGDDAWLGTGVIVLGGVTIGKGAVIGAGSVVTKNIPANSIALGIPARVAGFRDDASKFFQSKNTDKH